MGTPSKALEGKCVYLEKHNLAQIPDLWSCTKLCQLFVPEEAKLIFRDVALLYYY